MASENRSTEFKSSLASAVLGSLLVTAPLAFGSVQVWAKALIGVHVLILLLLWLWSKNQQLILPSKGMAAVLAAVIVWTFASSIYSIYPAQTLRESFDWLLMAVLLIMVMNLFSDRDRALDMVYVAIGAAVAMCGLAFARRGLGLWPSDRPGLVGPYVNHNHFCGLLEIVTPLALTLTLFSLKRGHKNNRRIIGCGIAFVVLGMTMVLTLSRAGIASMFTAILVVAMAAAVMSTFKRFYLFLLATAGIVGAVVVVQWPVFKALVLSLRASSSWLRLDLWQSTLEMIRAAPLKGFGLGTFPWVSYQFRSAEVGHHLNYAHQEFLQAGAELGVPAMLGVCFLVFYPPLALVRACTRGRRSSTMAVGLGAAMGLLSLALHGLYDFNYHLPANVVFAVVITACAFIVVGDPTWTIKVPARQRYGHGVLSVAAGLALLAMIVFGAADVFFWGGQRWQRNNDPRAQTAYEWAVRLNPWSAEYATQLAGLCFQRQDYAAAKPLFERGLHLNRRLANNAYHLALIARSERDFPAAQKYFESAVAWDPQESKKVLAYYDFLVFTNQIDLALLTGRDFLARHPGFLRDFMEIGRTAGISLSRLSIMVPDDLVSNITFGRYLEDRKEKDLLAIWVRDMAQHQAPLPQIFWLLAKSAWDRGHESDAVFFCEEGLARFPHDEALTEFMAQIDVKHGQWQNAAQLYRSEMELRDDTGAWLDRLLGLYYTNHQDDQALLLLSSLHDQYPKSAAFQERLADHYYRSGKWSEAVDLYRTMLARGARQSRYHATLADLYAQHNLWDSAADQWEHFLQMEPKRTDAMFAVAEIYERLQRPAQARLSYQRILKVSPHDAKAQERLKSLQGLN